MKRLITFLMLLTGAFTFAQVSYIGQGTTAQINGLTVPSGRSALIYDSTLSQYGFKNSASTWFWLITEADIDTFAELDAIVSDESLVNTDDAQTLTNKTIAGGSNTLSNISLSSLQDVTGPIFLGRPSGSGPPTTMSTGTVFNLLITGGSINPDRLADADFGDFTVASGVATIDTGAVTSAKILDGTIDEADLDVSVNASLDLADSAVQTGDDASFNSLTIDDETLEGAYFRVGTGGTNQDWRMGRNGSSAKLLFQSEDGALTDTFTTVYTLDESGTPSDPTDLTDKAYVDAQVGGAASQLSDLSDVNTSTPTNRNVLVADGIDFESRALVEADISDLSHTVDTNTLGPDGDKGDITVGGSGTTLTIDAGAIDETQLDVSTNASLDLADSAVQPGENITGTSSNVADADYGDISVASGVWAVDTLSTDLASSQVLYDNTISGLSSTTVKAALDELDSDISAFTLSGYSYQTISTNQTLDNSDVSSGTSKRWNKVSSNVELTLDNTITTYGVPFVLESTADSVTVVKGSGTTLYVEGQSAAITNDAVTAYTRSPLTVIAESSNVFSVYGNTQNLVDLATVNPWLIDGYGGSVGSEANAIYATEAASGVYISTVSTSDATQSVATDSPSGSGTLSIQVVGDDGVSDRLRVEISGLTNGEIYEYEFSYRMVTGTSGRVRLTNGDGAVSFVQSFSGTSWTTQTGEFTFSNTTTSYIIVDLFAAVAGSASDSARFEFDIRLKND